MKPLVAAGGGREAEEELRRTRGPAGGMGEVDWDGGRPRAGPFLAGGQAREGQAARGKVATGSPPVAVE